jgi:hypothetical protein
MGLRDIVKWHFTRSDVYHRQTFKAEEGIYLFTLTQGNGPGWWHLKGEVAIPYDKEEMERWHRQWVQAEASWARGEKYDAPSLDVPETHKEIGKATPPNGGTRLTTNEVKNWASREASRLVSEWEERRCDL